MKLSAEELKELFALFTSCSNYEIFQIYNSDNEHYFLNEDLNEDYELVQSKAEYANDAWRAVIYFLHKRGYTLTKDGDQIQLGFIEEEFV